MNHTIENGIRGPAATIEDYSLLLGAVGEINLNEPPSKRPSADCADRDNVALIEPLECLKRLRRDHQEFLSREFICHHGCRAICFSRTLKNLPQRICDFLGLGTSFVGIVSGFFVCNVDDTASIDHKIRCVKHSLLVQPCPIFIIHQLIVGSAGHDGRT